MIRLVLGVFFICVPVLSATSSQFRVIKEWNYINYTWSNEQTHTDYWAQEDYIPQNNLIAGINFYDGYYYLAIPRMKIGIPVTLARINSANPRSAPLLEPFPSWELNKLGNCEALQNVQNLAVDSQGRMWIIDGGKTETLTKTPNTKCSPKIWLYDLKTNHVTTTYSFPEEVANTTSFLYDLVVDDTDGGFAYITDNSRIDPGIIVFSLTRNTSWKVRDSRTMRADPSAVVFKINNEVIRTPINIAGIALGPKTHINDQNITLNEDREVYYCPISSLHLYSVSTAYLKTEKYSKLVNGGFTQYVRDLGIKAAQSDGMKMDNKGILYYGLLSTTSIARWDSSTPFSSGQQVISKDDNYIQWPNSFAFDDAGNILVLTNSLEKYVQNKMSLTDPNFRILMAYVGGKSYAYDEDTLVYSVYETENQNITVSTTFTAPTASSSINSETFTTEKSTTIARETVTSNITTVRTIINLENVNSQPRSLNSNEDIASKNAANSGTYNYINVFVFIYCFIIRF